MGQSPTTQARTVTLVDATATQTTAKKLWSIVTKKRTRAIGDPHFLLLENN